MVNIDLTTLQGWNDLPDGTYDITVGAKAEGYTRIIQSEAVSVVKGVEPSTSPVSDFEFSGSKITKYNGTDTNVIIPRSYSLSEPVKVFKFFNDPNQLQEFCAQNGYNFYYVQNGTEIFVTSVDDYSASSSEIESMITNYGFIDLKMTQIGGAIDIFYSSYDIENYAMNNGYNFVVEYNSNYLYITSFEDFMNNRQIIDDAIGQYGYVTLYRLETMYQSFTSLNAIETYCNENGYNFSFIYGTLIYINSEEEFSAHYDDFWGVTIGTYQRIPIEGNAYSVTTLGYFSFAQNNSIVSVTILDNIQTIETQVFYQCNNLTDIVIGSSVASIDSSAFYSCPNLTSIEVSADNNIYDSRDNCNAIIETATNTLWLGGLSTIIPNSVTTIGTSAFEGSGITSINIPNSVTAIRGSAFAKTSLVSVVIPDSVTTINAYVFSYCTNLRNVTLSRNITKLTSYLFTGSGLRTFTVPDNITIIEDSAFAYCSSLNSVTLPSTLTNIGSGAFQNCSSLINITIPDSVTNIGSNAFSSSGLTSITFPSSVTTISSSILAYCSSLSAIDIPNTITAINNYAFRNCTRLNNIIIRAVNPPSLVANALTSTNNCPLYVPAISVEVYKAAAGWSGYMDRIQAIPE